MTWLLSTGWRERRRARLERFTSEAEDSLSMRISDQEASDATDWNHFWRFVRASKVSFARILGLALLSLAGSAIINFLPRIYGKLQQAFQNHDWHQLIAGLFLLLLYLAQQTSGMLRHVVREAANQRISRPRLLGFYASLLKLPLDFYNRANGRGCAYQRLGEALALSRNVTETLLDALDNLIQATVYALLLASLRAEIVLVPLVVIPVQFWTVKRFSQTIRALERRRVNLSTGLTSLLYESVGAITMVKVLRARRSLVRRVRKLLLASNVTEIASVGVQERAALATSFVSRFIVTLATAYLGLLFFSGQLLFSEVLAAYTIFQMLLTSA